MRIYNGNQSFESFYLRHFDNLEDLKNCTECLKNLSVYSSSIYYQVSQSSEAPVYRILTEDDYWVNENFWKNGGNNFTSSFVIGNLNNHPLNIVTSGSTRLYISNSGSIGLNTINPTEILTVNGNIDYSGRLKISGSSGSSGQFLKVSGSSNVWSNIFISDISDFNTYTSSLSSSISSLNSFSSSINAYTASNNTVINNLSVYTASMNVYTASVNTTITNLNLFTASIKTYTASVNTTLNNFSAYTASNNIVINNFSVYSSSMNVWTGSIHTYTASVNTILNNLSVYTASNNTIITNLNAFTASIKNYTSSLNIWTGSIENYTGSVNTVLNNLSVYTASNNTVITNLNSFTASLKNYTASLNNWTSSIELITGSYFIQNGNSFGATAILGTNDLQSLQFKTNNTVRMFISSSGNVGISTLNPQAVLHATSNTSIASSVLLAESANSNGRPYLLYKAEGVNYGYLGYGSTGLDTMYLVNYRNAPLLFYTNSTLRMMISSSGEIGVGITTPIYNFDLQSTTNAVQRLSTSATSSNIAALSLGWGGGTVSNNIANIGVIAGETKLRFATSTNVTASVANFNNFTRMVIDNAGLVGIGLDSPQTPLHISSSGAPFITIQRAGVGSHYIGVSTQSSGSVSDMLFDGNQAASGYFFRTRDSSNNIVSALSINKDGRLGLGTASPISQLHVLSSSGSVNIVAQTNSTSSAILSLISSRQYDLISDTSGGGTPIVGASGFAIRDTSSGQNRLTIDNVGNVSIGVTATTSPYNLRIPKNITGGVTSYGIMVDGTVQSDVTNVAFYNRVTLSTQATVFNLTSLAGYSVYQGTIGVGSIVTSSYGFYVDSTLIGATNNYAFYGNIASGSGRWNLYMNGNAHNYLAGNLSIGSLNTEGYSLRVSKNMTAVSASTVGYGLLNNGTIQTDITSIGYYFSTFLNTAVSSSISQVIHYNTAQGTLGNATNIVSQYGYYVNSNLTSAANNYGFFGNIPSASGNWNLYMGGTADNYINGRIGIGTLSLPDKTLSLLLPITGAATSFAFYNGGIVQNNVNTAYYNYTIIQSLTGSTISNLVGNIVVEGGSNLGTITNLGGFQVGDLNRGTTNYAYRGGITSGSGKWNIYMDGSAANFINGKFVIGTTTVSNRMMALSLPITGSTPNVYGLLNNGVIGADASSSVRYFNTVAGTAVGSGNTVDVIHYIAEQATLGSGSSIDNQTGFYVPSSVSSATNNYAFRSNLASAISGNTWNLYMAGNAPNYLAGNLALGTNTPHASASLDITSTTKVFLPPRMTTTQRDAIAVIPTGSIIFNISTLKHQGYNGTTWNDFF